MKSDNRIKSDFLSRSFAVLIFFIMLISCLSVMPSGESYVPGEIVMVGEMTVTKTQGSPAKSASSMQFSPESSGYCWAHVISYGLNSVNMIIKDITDPNDVTILLDEKVLFTGYRKPRIDTSQAVVRAGSIIQITAIPHGVDGTYGIVRGYFEGLNQPPIAEFTYFCEGLKVSVDASGSTDDGAIVSYAWNWGDGTFGSGKITSHIYAAPGTYTISLTVTDNYGLTDEESVEITGITNLAPVAVIGAPSHGYVYKPVKFVGTSSYDVDGSIVSYLWDFGDGEAGSGSVVEHAYDSEGSYEVTLTVTDNLDASNSATDTIKIVSAGIGQKEIVWTISNMFEMYLPDLDYNRTGGITFEELGRHLDVDGKPPWYNLREPAYVEKTLREQYPHIFYENPYSTMTYPEISIGYSIWAPFRLSIEARNVTDCNTRDDVIYIPDLNPSPSAPNDGWINASFYGTYMTTAALTASRLGTHYANWFFGVPPRENPSGSSDDGYWYQLMAKVQYSRDAAMGYLGWDGTGDVRTWFETENADRSLDYAWYDYWMLEGSPGGRFDIYTAYDYSEDIRQVRLALDPHNSTADSLVLLMWSLSWGMDAQVIRYLEAANILKKGLQGFMEDMYLNVSIGPLVSNTTLRGTMTYDLYAWADPTDSGWNGAWMLEAHHIDWCGNVFYHNSYPSPYNYYDPDQTDMVLRPSYSPWTTNFGKNVTYWNAPLEFDLEELEMMVIVLPKNDIIGIEPGVGISDKLDSYKHQELLQHSYWGQMSLGECYPDMGSYYDPVEKRIYLVGPIDFARNVHPLFPSLLLTGTPMFVFKVV